MTVLEMLNEKYLKALKTMNAASWEKIKALPVHPAKAMYMAIEITTDDIRANGGWNSEFYQEIDSMHKRKLLASNKHRQFSGHVTKYWLTEKGWKTINKGHAIC